MPNTAMANASIAHTTGNVTFIMIEYLKGMFPDNFFKHIHITSKMPYREFMIEENRQSDKFIHKNKPILVVKPRVIMGDNDIFMSMSRLTRNIEGYNYERTGGWFHKIFRDNVNDVTLSYLMNRIRVELTCSIIVETEYQQANLYNKLLNLHNENQIYKKHTATECLVPMAFINAISEISGMPIRDPETGLVRKFLNYLTSNSNRLFTFKEKNASQKEEFFIYNPIAMEYIFTNYSRDDPNKHGDVYDRAVINFIMTSEFNTMGMYALTTERDDVVQKANTALLMDTNQATKIIPFYTPQQIFRETDHDGYILFYSNIFMLSKDIPKDKPDVLDISGIFKDSALKDILDYHKKHGISNAMLFNFYIMKNSTLLKGILKGSKFAKDQKYDYEIDLDNQKINIYNKEYNSTYRIIIYVNNLYIMTLINRINDLENSYEKKLNPDT